MTHKYEITPDKLDEIVTKHFELMKKARFVPNLVVGVSLGGSIVGSIFAEKFGCDFSIDYRKNRRRYGKLSLNIKPEHKKILIVEDAIDSVRTIYCTTRDILEEVHPTEKNVSEIFSNWLNETKKPSLEEYKNELMIHFPDYDVRWFTIIYDSPFSQLYPHYYEYDSRLSDLSESWKINRPETITTYEKCRYPWKDKIIELFSDQFLTGKVNTLEEFYKKCPFTDQEVLENVSKDVKSITINIKIFIGDTEVTRETFFKICKQKGFTEYPENKTMYTEFHGELYFFDVLGDETVKKLTFGIQGSYRKFGEREGLMCYDCSIKSLPEQKFCVCCNHYVRTVEVLHKILAAGPFRPVDCSCEVYFKDESQLCIEGKQLLEDLGKIGGKS
jgi:hypoxanthine phosphoribosyltransferase